MTPFAIVLIWIFCSLPVCGAQTDSSPPDITVLGLGKLGVAVVKCLAEGENVTIHAWNRGVEKRKAVKDMATVHETAESAVQASSLTLIMIDEWDGVVQLIKDMGKKIWKDRTVVLFSTYTPTDIQKLQEGYLYDAAGTLVGGAIVGVPQTICSPRALILTSAHVPSLRKIGRNEAFLGDVGFAALANMAMILVITFGLAGQELAHLIIDRYGANEKFLEIFAPLAVEVAPVYTQMLLPMVSKSITTKQYERSYVPVGTFRRVLQMHANFMKDLGIADDTFLASYLRYLGKVQDVTFGPAAWIEQAVVKRDNLVPKSGGEL